MGQGGQVAPFHLVWDDSEPLVYDPALELSREETIVATQQESRRHIGPRIQGPRPLERGARLLPYVF